MKLLKQLSFASFICMSASSFAATGPCNVKEPHNAIFISGELLLWKPNQTGMTYCLSVSEFTSPLGKKNKEIHQASQWATGFRVGTGAVFIGAPCDISFYWTRFHNTSHGSSSKPFIIGSQLLGIGNAFPVGGSGVGGGKPHSTWDLDFDTAELDFGYRLCFNERYLLRPYFGVTAGWINQLQSIKYPNFLGTNNVVFSAKIKQTNDFNGVGPKLGLQGNMAMGAGFGIMGNFAASFFYGTAHNPVKYDINGDLADFPVPQSKVTYRQHRIIPALQAQVGLTWGIVCTKHFTIDLAALYEAQYFFGTWRNQNSAIQNFYIADAGYGNLMLQGGTWQLKLTF
ncbi:MAG: hypothetical protein K2P51_02355 [Rhabdochlamydiaceae bacterium]|nr:hypothetical protein [Rhabdochlamydiaceae bacterium]